mmetsp:Transcript_26467/g.69926  ORF Transcript_26467/g.69926 Transcript_26467/m.69926 type:complete len:210 (-) Transcript_26467:172-801(-)
MHRQRDGQLEEDRCHRVRQGLQVPDHPSGCRGHFLHGVLHQAGLPVHGAGPVRVHRRLVRLPGLRRVPLLRLRLPSGVRRRLRGLPEEARRGDRHHGEVSLRQGRDRQRSRHAQLCPSLREPHLHSGHRQVPGRPRQRQRLPGDQGPSERPRVVHRQALRHGHRPEDERREGRRRGLLVVQREHGRRHLQPSALQQGRIRERCGQVLHG